jgi:Cu/Ag efflux protein CusF
MKFQIIVAAGLFIVANTDTVADSGRLEINRAAPVSQQTKPGAQAPLSAGTVKKIDQAGGKVTIAHGPLENLGMPAMTMTFPVAKASLLDQVKVGDAIRFRALDINGTITVTSLERAK